MSEFPFQRPLGAVPLRTGRTEFRVWAPGKQVAVRLGESDIPLADASYGVHEATLDAGAGDDYRFVVDGEAWPDPCSRWQPEGIRGPSRIVDPLGFVWTDLDFRLPGIQDAVIYEVHVGTFSPEGTFDAAIPHLRQLADLGVTAIELMPVAEFPGERGWGYDGVYLSAAQSSYGGPRELQKLIDAAHAEGIAAVLDVVYNHVGASGTEAITAFGPYFTHKHETPWG